MSEPPVTAVRRLLRASEEVKVAIQAQAALPQELRGTRRGSFSVDEDEAAITQTDDSTRKRIVAVVTHVDTSTGDEQGW